MLSFLFIHWHFFVFSLFLYDCISLLLTSLLLCCLFHLHNQMDCILLWCLYFFLLFQCAAVFFVWGALVSFICPLVLLFDFSLFVYDCIPFWVVFLLGMLLSFLFIHWFFFFLLSACFCMIVFHCGFCTLLPFGHAVVFLIPPWFISFIQLKELCFIVFLYLGFLIQACCCLLIPPWFILLIQSNELHFIVAFVICFVLFWVSSCLPYSSTVPFIY